MSTTTTASSIRLPEDSENDGLIKDDCEDLMLTLPREKWFGSIYLHKYKDFWLGTNQLTCLISWQNHFEAQENDVLLITTPKSGTTWLKALMYTLVNRNTYPINQNHPLLNQNPHALVPFMELSTVSVSRDVSDSSSSSSSSSTRLFSTHSPLVLLPESFLNSGSKIVYLCRNIKDLFVSYWNFTKKLGTETSFEEIFEMFCVGVSVSGPVWDHILDYWKQSLEKPNKVMFLKYEDMKDQPAVHLRRLAEFMGCPFSPEEEKERLIDEILRLCSFDNLSNLDVNKKGKSWIFENHSYFRRGEVGDWKNYLTNEMAERLDQITAHKFHGSALEL